MSVAELVSPEKTPIMSVEVEKDKILDIPKIDVQDKENIAKDKEKLKRAQKKKEKYLSGKHNVIVFGSDVLAQNIIFGLLKLTDSNITVISTIDPNIIWNHVELGYMRRSYPEVAPRVSFIHTSELDTESMLDNLYKTEASSYDTVIIADSEANGTYIKNNPKWATFYNLDYLSAKLDSLRRLTKFNKESKIIHLSHWSIYGEQDIMDMPFKESLLPNPIGLRGNLRFAQENLLKGVCNTYGLNYIILRLGTVVGPYTEYDNIMSTFVKNAIRQETLKVHGLGSQSRDLVFTDDVQEVVCLLSGMKSQQINNEVFNFGGNDVHNVSKKQLIDTEKTAKRTARAIQEGLRLMHTDKTINIDDNYDSIDKEDSLRVILDNKKLEDVLEDLPYTHESLMIRKTAHWMAKYVLKVDKLAMERLEVLLGQKQVMQTSEENIKMYENRYGVDRSVTTLRKPI
jgi:nucleoside-diphosphate-sugar epimerase